MSDPRVEAAARAIAMRDPLHYNVFGVTDKHRSAAVAVVAAIDAATPTPPSDQRTDLIAVLRDVFFGWNLGGYWLENAVPEAADAVLAWHEQQVIAAYRRGNIEGAAEALEDATTRIKALATTPEHGLGWFVRVDGVLAALGGPSDNEQSASPTSIRDAIEAIPRIGSGYIDPDRVEPAVLAGGPHSGSGVSYRLRVAQAIRDIPRLVPTGQEADLVMRIDGKPVRAVYVAEPDKYDRSLLAADAVIGLEREHWDAAIRQINELASQDRLRLATVLGVLVAARDETTQ